MRRIKRGIQAFIEAWRAARVGMIRLSRGGGERFVLELPCGLKLDLRFRDATAMRFLLDGQFEPQVSAVAFALIRPGMTVLDIGANIGVHTLHFSKLVRADGLVLAIEPNPVARGELERNIALNGISNVRVFPDVLWEREGEEEFFYPVTGQEAMGGLASNRRFRAAYEARVHTSTLDGLLGRNGIEKVDFVKLDVEGAELQVLRGATHLFRAGSAPPILYESTENNTAAFSYGPDDVRQFLSSRGYLIQQIDQEDYLAIPFGPSSERRAQEARL